MKALAGEIAYLSGLREDKALVLRNLASSETDLLPPCKSAPMACTSKFVSLSIKSNKDHHRATVTSYLL